MAVVKMEAVRSPTIRTTRTCRAVAGRGFRHDDHFAKSWISFEQLARLDGRGLVVHQIAEMISRLGSYSATNCSKRSVIESIPHSGTSRPPRAGSARSQNAGRPRPAIARAVKKRKPAIEKISSATNAWFDGNEAW